MIINCGVCDSEERNDEYHKMYRHCDLYNTKHAPKFYYFTKDKKLEKEKNHYYNNKEIFNEKI